MSPFARLPRSRPSPTVRSVQRGIRSWDVTNQRSRPVIEENGVRLRLNIVDTPGYGDQVNNDRWY